MHDLGELIILEDSEYNYQNRTRRNAEESDWTFSFDVDSNSSGSKCTRKYAKGKYTSVDLWNWDDDIHLMKRVVQEKKVKICNIAGNGISNLEKHGWIQSEVNDVIFICLRTLKCYKLPEGFEIRTGGQTGADFAGAVAGLALGYKVTMLYPKGFRMRYNGKDHTHTEEQIRKWVIQQAKNLKSLTY